MQYGEDDLRFITRLLGEVGIWFRFTTDTRLNIDVVEFYDSQQGMKRPDAALSAAVGPAFRRSGRGGEWRATITWCRSRSAPATTITAATDDMNTEVDVTRGDATTCGDAYHWGQLPYPVMRTTAIRLRSRGVLCPHSS